MILLSDGQPHEPFCCFFSILWISEESKSNDRTIIVTLYGHLQAYADSKATITDINHQLSTVPTSLVKKVHKFVRHKLSSFQSYYGNKRAVTPAVTQQERLPVYLCVVSGNGDNFVQFLHAPRGWTTCLN